jgi:hypothetical protein
MSRPTRADAAGRAYLDLQNLARRQGRATQVLLVTYVLERFLARLAAGPDAEPTPRPPHPSAATTSTAEFGPPCTRSSPGQT